MRNTIIIIIKLTVVLASIAIVSCTKKCNDCKEIEGKQIIVVDEEGNNLVFGNNPVYTIDSIQFVDKQGNNISFIESADSEVLYFGLELNHDLCYLHLNATETDTISFVIFQEDSESCCGQVTRSSQTFLNNIEIENSAIIEIIK